jgi:hypothetical protein
MGSIIEQLFQIRHPEWCGERINLTFENAVGSMPHGANLPVKLWGEALLTANYVRNGTPVRGLKGKVLEEAYRGHKPSVDLLRVFGSRAGVLNE